MPGLSYPQLIAPVCWPGFRGVDKNKGGLVLIYIQSKGVDDLMSEGGTGEKTIYCRKKGGGQ